ncbi:hypothetical protein M2444_001735 [Paenibacillus sp. PastF-3]|uniref:hypothetical protein n=1 Tax=Paenibacillus sp. PastF-3 TaxID=2940626 RepID=UPI0024734E19|nr:hypothetical protein [Paenibacillus sp. PastF-3]MDH6369957.1 hypothetical protein [Paenibacillus sp. PastF-3]
MGFIQLPVELSRLKISSEGPRKVKTVPADAYLLESCTTEKGIKSVCELNIYGEVDRFDHPKKLLYW